MNIANKLTLFRIILVPVFLVCLLLNFPYHGFWALAVFVIASLTDMLDGKLARKHNLVTEFGKLMDPLADKVLVISALIAFVELSLIPAWMVIIIVARELLVTSVRLVAVNSGEVIAASFWGKLKTVTQLIGIIVIMLEMSLVELNIKSLEFLENAPHFMGMNFTIGTIIMLIATLLTVFSGVDYMKNSWKLIDYKK